MRELRTLYPEIEPFDAGRLKVSPVHELYDLEQYGHELDGHELYYEHAAVQQGSPSSFSTVDQTRVWSGTIDASSTHL